MKKTIWQKNNLTPKRMVILWKRCLPLSLFLLGMCLILGIGSPATHASAKQKIPKGCTKTVSKVNMHSCSTSHNYSTWSSPAEAFLFALENNQYLRVENASSYFIVECFNENYQSMWVKKIKKALPIWGAVGYDGTDFFVVTGQSNLKENRKKPVFMITRYNKNWEETGEVSVTNCYTTIPFEAGSCSIAFYGNTMYIRTARQMYKDTDDGVRHQANITIVIDKQEMRLIDKPYSMSNYLRKSYDYGYASHSFNQIIRMDEDLPICVDHGDAYPRSIVLNFIQEEMDVSEEEESNKYVHEFDLLKFAGKTGDNTTGASLGDFQISNTSYLVCGTSVDQTKAKNQKKLIHQSKRNIFLSVLNKSTKKNTLKWLTAYKNSSSLENPYLVKITNRQFVLLWKYKNTLYYQELNSDGEFTSKLYKKKGYQLSSCAPIVADGRIQWYDTTNKKIIFYSLPFTQMEDVPEQPQNIQTKITKKDSITITWDAVNNADGYYLYRKEEGGEYTKIADCGTKTKYIDYDCKQHATYYYSVSAYNNLWNQRQTESSRNENGIKQVYVEPMNIDSISCTKNGLQINWTKREGADGYVLYKYDPNSDDKNATSFQPYQVITSGECISYTDTAVTSGNTYQYSIAEVYQGTEGFYDSKGKSYLFQSPPPLEKVEVIRGRVLLELNSYYGFEQWKVFRRENGGEWTQIDTNYAYALYSQFENPTIKILEDVSALQTGKWYEYKMIWKSSDSPTAYQSAETDIYKVCVADSVVPTLKVGTYFGDPITIQWNPVENAVGYRIYTAIPYTETRDGQTTEREAYQYLGETTKKETTFIWNHERNILGNQVIVQPLF